MTQEDKELLLKDLCARSPYGVKIKVRSNDNRTVRMVDTVKEIVHFAESDSISPFGVNIEHPLTFCQIIKPYLRPMSSMTEEEREILRNINDFLAIFPERREVSGGYKTFDYLNSIHVDCRGLIPKGLALEAPDGMYDTIAKA